MDMPSTQADKDKLEDLRKVVAEVLELEPEQLSDEGDFRREYEADSMRAIEILSRLEKRYRITIPQSELAAMQNLLAVYSIVERYAGWKA